MNIAGLFSRPLYWLAGKVFSIWARPEIQPDVPSEYITSPDAKVCYVLETGGLADVLALERAAAQHGMPSPTEPFEFCGNREYRRFIILRRMKGFWYRRPHRAGSQRLKRIVEAAGNGDEELLLIPVAIYWGRSPEKERSLLKLLFSENWDVIGRTRKFFTTILHGRNTLLRFSHALPLRSIDADADEPEIAFRKVSRILRVHFRKRRAATVGPDLSHRRTLIRDVLRAPEVRRAIELEGGDDFRKQELARRKAEKYALEIAADISYPTIRVLLRLLRWLWSKIYDGIELNHMEKLHEVAKDKEVIYAPCHRSHIDYLLLGYVTYTEGLHLPHIAAGINLNMPIVGGILRRGGAFFLRRSFKGNRLYATVFDSYIQQVLGKGYSMEYFIEGGRSRTGRLLQPKGGMLVMTINSYVRNPQRPIVFVPIYFGYEKLIEGDDFISELGGAEKKKESIAHPEWRNFEPENGERPPWLAGIVDTVGVQIMENINSAAAVTPISLLAYVLLATPKQTIGLDELRRQLQLSLDLLRRFEYSDLVTLPDWSPDFRNNILHLFAVPASIACCFIQGQELEHKELQRLIRLIYPFMKKELFLKWDLEQVYGIATEAIESLCDLGILSYGKRKKTLVRPPAGSARAFQLLMLGQSMVPMLQRFYLVIAILVGHGSGTLSRARLETMCQQSAERLSMIYGLHSPDFFNKSLFHDFIKTLQAQDVLRRNSNGAIEFDDDITSIGADARLVLGEEIRHSILSLTLASESGKTA
jgi:glycerol-3-phosphate O-acyltransferase